MEEAFPADQVTGLPSTAAACPAFSRGATFGQQQQPQQDVDCISEGWDSCSEDVWPPSYGASPFAGGGRRRPGCARATSPASLPMPSSAPALSLSRRLPTLGAGTEGGSPSRGGGSGRRLEGGERSPSVASPGDCAWLEEPSVLSGTEMDMDDESFLGCADFVPWSGRVAQTIQDDHEYAIWTLSPATLRLLVGSCPPMAAGAGPAPLAAHALDAAPALNVAAAVSTHRPPGARAGAAASAGGGGGGGEEGVLLALAEVAHRPRPLELLVLAVAFSHLARPGSSRRLPLGKIDSRSPEVERFLLKYTCLESRAALRSELSMWCPVPSEDWVADESSFVWDAPPKGPDDAGPALDFELLAAFIGTHAAPRGALGGIFRGVRAGMKTEIRHGGDIIDASDDLSKARVVRRHVQRGLEEALGPLLTGFDPCGAEGGSSASRLARTVARRAAWLTAQAGCSVAQIDGVGLSVEDFLELHDRAAILGRVLMANFSGDIALWRGGGAFAPGAPSSQRGRRGLGGG